MQFTRGGGDITDMNLEPERCAAGRMLHWPGDRWPDEREQGRGRPRTVGTITMPATAERVEPAPAPVAQPGDVPDPALRTHAPGTAVVDHPARTQREPA